MFSLNESTIVTRVSYLKSDLIRTPLPRLHSEQVTTSYYQELALLLPSLWLLFQVFRGKNPAQNVQEKAAEPASTQR
jgi:hypothetical protein